MHALSALQFGESKDLAVTTSSARATVPDKGGSASRPGRWFLLTCLDPVYFRPGDVTVTAIVGDVLIQPNNPLVVNLGGHTNIAAIEPSGGTGTVLNIAALENM